MSFSRRPIHGSPALPGALALAATLAIAAGAAAQETTPAGAAQRPAQRYASPQQPIQRMAYAAPASQAQQSISRMGAIAGALASQVQAQPAVQPAAPIQVDPIGGRRQVAIVAPVVDASVAQPQPQPQIQPQQPQPLPPQAQPQPISPPVARPAAPAVGRADYRAPAASSRRRYANVIQTSASEPAAAAGEQSYSPPIYGPAPPGQAMPRPIAPPRAAAQGPVVTQVAGYQDALTLPPPEASGDLIADVRDPDVELNVVLRRSKLIRTRRLVTRVAIADPDIIEMVEFSPSELEVIGRQTGTTTMTLWFQPDRPDQRGAVLRYLVTVSRDESVDDQRRLEYGAFERMLNEMFPGSMIHLIPLADKLVVRGQARDAEEAAQIMAIVRGEASTPGGDTNAGFVASVAQGRAAEPFPDASTLPINNVISMLEVPGEQQVMLKVRIAELKRTALRQLGVNFEVSEDNLFLSSLLTGGSNVLGIFDGEDVEVLVRALTTNRTMKLLAEPNLVTLSGHTANFIAGGEFAVPTVVGVDGVGAATTQFRGFGTQVTFTPTVLDKDRIRLQVAPEFSAINSNNEVQGIPGLDTRAAFTTVDLREGQWLAIAGLIQDSQDGSNARVPFLGDIPIVGVLFSSKEMSRNETELIVLVSPELVHAMDPQEMPSLLPGSDVTEPPDGLFYCGGRIEGRAHCDHRSTVWPQYRHQIRDARHGRDGRVEHYVCGPNGYSE